MSGSGLTAQSNWWHGRQNICDMMSVPIIAQHDLRRFHTLSPLHRQKASTRRIVDKRDPAFTRLGLIAIGTGIVNSNRKQRAWESDNIA
jgi:hypothetical protein